MTAGFLSSSDNKNSLDTSLTKQDNPANSTITPLSSHPGRFQAFALFCLQHPDFLKLVIQLFLTIVILSFSIFQLVSGGRDGQGKNDALYWGCISSILAWWMPSPAGYTSGNQANIAGDMNINPTLASGNPPLGKGNGAFRS